MTLIEFIERNKFRPVWPLNAYVDAPGFESFYVRMTTRYFNRRTIKPVLDIANITAEKPGNGAFKALLNTLWELYPNLSIYVESVQSEQFQGFFRRHPCFVEVPDRYPPCFLYEAPHG